MRPAVFLDRDGTVNEEVGYINHIERLRIFPWAGPAICRLNHAGFCVILITNQSGVGRGYFPESLVCEVHDKLRSELADAGAYVDAIYYCPHHPDAAIEMYRQDCPCRKPRLGMLERAVREWHLDLGSSFLIGDKYLDMEMAFRAGIRSVLVLSGYGRGEYLYLSATWPRQPDHVAEDLSRAVDWILSQARLPNLSVAENKQES